MNLYKIADVIVELDCFGEILRKQGEPYRVDGDIKADILINIGKEKLQKIREQHSHLTFGELEYIKTGFDFYHNLLEFDGFCLHSSAVSMNNKAILFSAPSGTGKSTHANLWQQYFGPDKAMIINDDKPAIRLEDGIFYVYGTPWSGKTDRSVNIKVPLQAIVFLEQAKENNIKSLDHGEAVKMLIYNSLRPNDPKKMDKLLMLIGTLLKNTPVYRMSCSVSNDAVELVYNTINNKRKG